MHKWGLLPGWNYQYFPHCWLRSLPAHSPPSSVYLPKHQCLSQAVATLPCRMWVFIFPPANTTRGTWRAIFFLLSSSLKWHLFVYACTHWWSAASEDDLCVKIHCAELFHSTRPICWTHLHTQIHVQTLTHTSTDRHSYNTCTLTKEGKPICDERPRKRKRDIEKSPQQPTCSWAKSLELASQHGFLDSKGQQTLVSQTFEF